MDKDVQGKVLKTESFINNIQSNLIAFLQKCQNKHWVLKSGKALWTKQFLTYMHLQNLGTGMIWLYAP